MYVDVHRSMPNFEFGSIERDKDSGDIKVHGTGIYLVYTENEACDLMYGVMRALPAEKCSAVLRDVYGVRDNG